MLTIDLDNTLGALADPTRRQMLEMLGRRPQRAGELAMAFPLKGPAVSRHLRILRESGLIEEVGYDQDRRVRLYQLRQEPLTALAAWLDQVRAYWSEQLTSFAQAADAAQQARHREP
jgi:DNA-binding transcriptional ArsR family regulator